MLNVLPADGRGLEGLSGPAEQTDAHILFQVAQEHAQGGGRDEQLLSRLCDGPASGQRTDIGLLFQIHTTPPAPESPLPGSVCLFI